MQRKGKRRVGLNFANPVIFPVCDFAGTDKHRYLLSGILAIRRRLLCSRRQNGGILTNPCLLALLTSSRSIKQAGCFRQSRKFPGKTCENLCSTGWQKGSLRFAAEKCFASPFFFVEGETYLGGSFCLRAREVFRPLCRVVYISFNLSGVVLDYFLRGTALQNM